MKFSIQFGAREIGFQIGSLQPRAAIADPAPAPAKTGGELLKSRGAVFPNARRRMYAAAAVSRLTADQSTSTTSANAEIQVSAPAVRSRNRTLERDDDYFRGMLRLVENNVVGHMEGGIKLQMKIQDVSGKDANGRPVMKLDEMANTMIEAAWAKYMQPEHCTVMRNMSGGDLQRLVVRRFGPDGGILLRKHAGFKNAFGFAIEPIEIDRLDFNYCGRETTTGNEILFGLELDRFNAVVAYHILNRHPGDSFGYQRPRGPGKLRVLRERVPASEIIFVGGSIERGGQVLPMPLWSSVARRLHQLGKYEEAVQVASRIAACKGGFIKKVTPPGEFKDGPVQGEGDDRQALQDVEPGLIQELGLDEDFVPFDPRFPMAESGGHIKTQLRGASAGTNLSYINVANDLEGTSFSSGRTGILEVREEYMTLQQRLITYLMRPWFEDWLLYAILSGQVKLPIGKVEKFKASSWRPRRWPWVSPKEDIQASKDAIAMRIKSRQDVIEEGGGDMQEVDAQFAADPHMSDLPVHQAYLQPGSIAPVVEDVLADVPEQKTAS